jgi:hypothetical protein
MPSQSILLNIVRLGWLVGAIYSGYPTLLRPLLPGWPEVAFRYDMHFLAAFMALETLAPAAITLFPLRRWSLWLMMVVAALEGLNFLAARQFGAGRLPDLGLVLVGLTLIFALRELKKLKQAAREAAPDAVRASPAGATSAASGPAGPGKFGLLACKPWLALLARETWLALRSASTPPNLLRLGWLAWAMLAGWAFLLEPLLPGWPERPDDYLQHHLAGALALAALASAALVAPFIHSMSASRRGVAWALPLLLLVSIVYAALNLAALLGQLGQLGAPGYLLLVAGLVLVGLTLRFALRQGRMGDLKGLDRANREAAAAAGPASSA